MKNKQISEKHGGIILGYAIVIAEGLSGLVFTTILLSKLGQDAYGLYKLAVSWTSLVSVLDFGLGGTITRYIVKYRVRKDTNGERNFLGMAYIVYAILAAAVLLCGIGLSIFLPLFSKSILAEQRSEFRILFLLLVLKTAVTMFNHAYSGRFSAYEKFVFVKSVTLVSIILRLLLATTILVYVPSVIAMGSIDLILTVVTLAANIIAAKLMKLEPIQYKQWDQKLFKEIFAFTSSIFAIALINQFNSNIDNIVLGVFSTTAIIGLYASILQIYSVYCSISTVIQDVFAPQVFRSVFSGGDNDEITETIVAPSRIQLFVLLLAFSGFVFFGSEFLEIWLGRSYTSYQIRTAYIVGVLIMGCSTWHLFQNSAVSILRAKNMLKGRALLIAGSTVINFFITIVLVPKLGMIGAAIGTAFSLLFGYGIATNIYYSKVVKINLNLYYTKVFSGMWSSILLYIPLGIMIRAIPLSGLSGFLFRAVLYSVLYCLIIYGVSLNNEEKEYIKKFLSR